MRWLKPGLRNSIYGLLGNPAPPSDSSLENSTEEIRESMLELLGETGQRNFPHITRRLRYATDVHALWYLRGDLMGALADLHSETVARQKVAEISGRFHGLLPGSLSTRPSPLVS